ncbi:Phospholipid/glycerol acyltransferase, partial [Trinorchestia longiramus]
ALQQVEDEARDILKIMGHEQDISAIRKFAFFLAKMVKAMYNKIVVHRPGIEMLRKAIQICPVVILPTHRSYADFILVSYLSYHYNLPFPVIAAGMDFYHMTYIGQLLREAGAFYIKRSFMDDVLYWAIFQEYVKLLVCRESAPLEFFLEGTRSRTAKTLRPKLGLLGCICQYSCLDEVSDVLVVPVNISYDRTLEEELYAWELLGIPKPKESTS